MPRDKQEVFLCYFLVFNLKQICTLCYQHRGILAFFLVLNPHHFPCSCLSIARHIHLAYHCWLIVVVF